MRDLHSSLDHFTPAHTSHDEHNATDTKKRTGQMEALEQERQRLRMLIDLLPDFIFVKDARRRFLIANKAIARAYGCAPSEMISRTDADFLSPEMAVRCRAPEQQVLAGKSISIEDTISFPDGKTRTMVTNMAPFRDGHGVVCGLVGIGRDITQRKRAEENMRQSEERYHILFKTLIEGFCTVEVIFDGRGKPVDFRFLEVNPAFEKQTGIHNAEGRSMRELVPENESHWYEIYGKIALTGEPAHFENEAKALGRCFDVYAYRVGGPDSRKVAILFSDITARKRSEQLLQRANRTLQAIRDCHEAMLRAETESELLEQVCHIIVHTGGEQMAWVGFAERNAQKTVRPIAAAGSRKQYLSKARLTWADTIRGRGPVGTAIRTGKVSLCQNTLTDPDFAPWREDARRQGYGSMIALPLMADKQCFGALAIYAPEADGFDTGEQLQLTSLANDLALGVYMLRLQADRERLEHEILHSIEREQKRIGRDLHDGLCQLLVGAKLRSVYMESMARGRYPALVEEAQALEETLSEAIDQARDLARGLNPVKVSPAGLPAALQKLADDVDQVKGPHCLCHIPEGVKISGKDAAYHLYHIAQEAVQNALKHARAENISITLVRRDGHVTLFVEDDGVGISKSKKQTGMGLRNMQARARLIGGRLEIRARKRSGTIVSCELFEKPREKP